MAFSNQLLRVTGKELMASILASLYAVSIIFSSIAASAAQPHSASDYVKDGTFTKGIEGPVVDGEGTLYAVNFAEQGSIGKVTGKDEVSLFVHLPDGSIGNGLRFNAYGLMLVADYVNHNVLAVDMKTKVISVYAHNDQMNQPNDIAISANDIVYASDPDWDSGTGKLWMIPKAGETVLIEEGMGTTNGIEVCADGRYLYVNESMQRNVWRYRLDEQGLPKDKARFYQFVNHGLDGMRCDSEGNLYIARYGAGTIAVLSADGELRREIKLKGQYPTNLAFGGKDGKQVYVTMQKRGAIETFTAEFPGGAFHLQHQ